MRHDGPRLTDADLRRLARLGGAVEQIAEAAGIDAPQVRLRLGTRRSVASPARLALREG